MKKFIALLLISVLLLMGGCSIGRTPNFSVCKKFSGTICVAKTEFQTDVDFSEKNPQIIVNNSKNAFNTEYEFFAPKVKIKYDNIESTVNISDLSKGNTALIIYNVYNEVSQKKSVKWKRVKSEKKWYFNGKYDSYSFSGACDDKGKIVSFSVPKLSVNYKIKNFG